MASPHIRVSAGDRRQQILEVATDLFARQGFNGTTTRQIAQRAAVNEAIIFRHFPTKDDLYWAVIENQCQIRGGRAKLEELLDDLGIELPVLIHLAHLGADGILRKLSNAVAKHLLIFGEGDQGLWTSQNIFHKNSFWRD